LNKLFTKILFAVLTVMLFVGAAQAQENNVAVVASANVDQNFARTNWQIGIDGDYNFSKGFVLSNRFAVLEALPSANGDGNVVTDSLFLTKNFGTGTFRPTVLVGGELKTHFNPRANDRVFTPTVGVGLNVRDQFIFRAEALTRAFGSDPDASGARFTGEYFYRFGDSHFGAKAVASAGFLVLDNGLVSTTVRSYNVGGGVFYRF